MRIVQRNSAQHVKVKYCFTEKCFRNVGILGLAAGFDLIFSLEQFHTWKMFCFSIRFDLNTVLPFVNRFMVVYA